MIKKNERRITTLVRKSCEKGFNTNSSDCFQCYVCNNSFLANKADYILHIIYKVYKPHHGYEQKIGVCSWCFKAMQLNIIKQISSYSGFYHGYLKQLGHKPIKINFGIFLVKLSRLGYSDKNFIHYIRKFIFQNNNYEYRVNTLVHKADVFTTFANENLDDEEKHTDFPECECYTCRGGNNWWRD